MLGEQKRALFISSLIFAYIILMSTDTLVSEQRVGIVKPHL